jgi:hypothetical protein
MYTNFEAETFVNRTQTRKATFWEYEDKDYLIVTWEHRGISESSFWTPTHSIGARHRVRLEDLKRIFVICCETSEQCLIGIIDDHEFCIEIVSPGENRRIYFRENNKEITVQFVTKGLYIDKSDPCNWVERDYIWELGDEHKLTCKDLYRIRKMCKISDLY